jgi:hypothetical protein
MRCCAALLCFCRCGLGPLWGPLFWGPLLGPFLGPVCRSCGAPRGPAWALLLLVLGCAVLALLGPSGPALLWARGLGPFWGPFAGLFSLSLCPCRVVGSRFL